MPPMHWDPTINPALVVMIVMQVLTAVWFLGAQKESLKSLKRVVEDLHSLVVAMNTRLTRLEALDEGAQRDRERGDF